MLTPVPQVAGCGPDRSGGATGTQSRCPERRYLQQGRPGSARSHACWDGNQGGPSADEWAFAAPYLVLMRPDAPEHTHDPREVDNALRWIVRAGAPWRYLPGEFLPRKAVSQQIQRWIAAGCSELMVHDLRALLRWTEGRDDDPSAVIFDGHTVQSTLESGARAGHDGHKRRKGSKIHLAVDTLGHLLALKVTPANAQDRTQMGDLTAAVQAAKSGSGCRPECPLVAFVTDGGTGGKAPVPLPKLGRCSNP
jgi:transposase